MVDIVGRREAFGFAQRRPTPQERLCELGRPAPSKPEMRAVLVVIASPVGEQDARMVQRAE